MKVKNTILAAGLITGLSIFSSCQKDVAEPKAEVHTPAVTREPTSEFKLKDSALIYSRDIYLWYQQIPSTFDPQTYADPNLIMNAIRSYSIEPGYSAPVDRWSYAIKKSEWDNISMGLNSAAADDNEDFGLNVFFRAEGDLRVRYVEKQSPAGLAGVRRGWKITKINGSTNITTGNTNFISNGVYESTSGTFTFQKPDGSSADITLRATSYKQQPVVLDTVYTLSGRKVGYLVFNSFLGDTAAIYRDLQRVFDRFSQQQVNEAVIDLRYNGGGYVTVQQKLANYLINAGNNGQVMMKEQFNNKYTRFNNTTTFVKLGALNLNRITFIVSSSTASASELLINNLKPYMDVRLVGPSKTHGKPVGFFPIPVGEWYIFPVAFRTVNKNGEGNYFNGLPLTSQAADGIDKDWGDRSEASLAFILNGTSTAINGLGASGISGGLNIEAFNSKLSGHNFKGTIDTRGMF